jgi:hypothetical protein
MPSPDSGAVVSLAIVSNMHQRQRKGGQIRDGNGRGGVRHAGGPYGMCGGLGRPYRHQNIDVRPATSQNVLCGLAQFAKNQ